MNARHLHPASLQAGWWALRAARAVRPQLARHALAQVVLPAPPRSASSATTVAAVLRRIGASCLQQAVVLQAFHAGRGIERDVVIGIRGPSTTFEAHAWLEGDPAGGCERFDELLRRPASRLAFRRRSRRSFLPARQLTGVR